MDDPTYAGVPALSPDESEIPTETFSLMVSAMFTSNKSGDDSDEDPSTAFKRALMEEDDQAVMYLAEKESDLDVSGLRFDDQGNTGLHVAVQKQNMVIIVYLLDYGVDVECSLSIYIFIC